VSFVERVGGVLVAPRATLPRAAAAHAGLRDLWILLGLRLFAGETIRLVRAALAIRPLGARAAFAEVVRALTAVGPELLAVFAGAIVLGLAAGRRGRSNLGELDLAVYAWVPYLAGTAAIALVDTALQRAPGRAEEILGWLSMAWAAAVWGLALWTARSAPAEAA
jgi:hypothetical protein